MPEFVFTNIVLTGGFPCQDISTANVTGKGIDGPRSGLWSELFQSLCLLRPAFAVFENSPNLTNRGLGKILCDLASVGYDAEWFPLSVRQFGGPHLRKRLFIVAYPNSIRFHASAFLSGVAGKGTQKETTGWPALGGQLIRGASWEDWRGSVAKFGGLDDGIPAELVQAEFHAYGNAVCPAVAGYVLELVQNAYARIIHE